MLRFLTVLVVLLSAPRSPEAAPPRTYVHREMGLSFCYPDDWDVTPSSGTYNYDDTPAISIDRMEHLHARLGIVGAYFEVVVEKSGTGTLASRAAQDVHRLNAGPQGDATFRVSTRRRTIAGFPALDQRMEGRLPASEWKLLFRQVYIRREGLMYLVTGVNPSLESAVFERAFDTVLQTLRFQGRFVETPKPPPPGIDSLPHLTGNDRPDPDHLTFYVDASLRVLAAPAPSPWPRDERFFWGDGKDFRQLATLGTAFEGDKWVSLTFGRASSAGTLKNEGSSALLECRGMTRHLDEQELVDG